MDKKSDTGKSLKVFTMELGVSEELMVDGSKEEKSPGTEFMKCCQRNEILLTRNEPEITNHNPAEGVNSAFLRQWLQTMVRKRVHINLWDYGFRWNTQLMQIMSTKLCGLRET